MYRELGRCHTHPYKKKAGQTENGQLFLDPSGNNIAGKTAAPRPGETGESGESPLRSAYLKQSRSCWSQQLLGRVKW